MSVRPLARSTSCACAALRRTAPRSWLRFRNHGNYNTVGRSVSTKTAEGQQRVRKLQPTRAYPLKRRNANLRAPRSCCLLICMMPTQQCSILSKQSVAFCLLTPSSSKPPHKGDADWLGNCRRRKGRSTLSTLFRPRTSPPKLFWTH